MADQLPLDAQLSAPSGSDWGDIDSDVEVEEKRKFKGSATYNTKFDSTGTFRISAPQSLRALCKQFT